MEADTIPSQVWESISKIQFYAPNIEDFIGMFFLIILLILSGLISGSEASFFALSPKDIKRLNKKDNKKGAATINLLKKPEQLLGSILIANNFINIGIVLLSAKITTSIVDFTYAPTIGFIFQTIVITFILLLFGEIIPKVYASKQSYSFSLRMTPTFSILTKLFKPMNLVLIKSTSIVNKKVSHHKNNMSISDLSHALSLTEEQEIKEDKEILEGIVKFGKRSVVEIMCSRLDTVSLDYNESFNTVIETINESGFSRIPIYEDTFDNIKGILYIKDLLIHLHKGNTFRWQTLIRPPFYIPENKKIDDLLEDFQKSKVHMAFVIDEYGGVSGIVTLEDVLEEIVGEISDEFDEDEKNFTQIDNQTYLFDAKTLLVDFLRDLHIEGDFLDDAKGDADTLAGLLLEIKGDFPLLKEKIVIGNIDFIVEKMDARRIIEIRVIYKQN
ncbi:gliding motility-associated protein GldE [Prolixibacteraceae bacterium]|nr:gliding motility-associated protein GldE [Prolixibacteraceae bacterium]